MRSLPSPRFPRCFLSISFLPADRPLLEWFKALGTAVELTVVTGDAPEARPPVEKIREMIRGSDCVAAVLTRREKIEGKEEWTAPTWAQNEIGMALALGKTPAVFAEEGVAMDGVIPSTASYVRFSRERLGDGAPEVVRYLVDLRNRVSPRITSEGDIATMRALADEILTAASNLAQEKEKWTAPFLFLAHLSAQKTGRLFLLPEELQEQIETAYEALEKTSELASKSVGDPGILQKIVGSAASGAPRTPKLQFDETMTKTIGGCLAVSFRLLRECNPRDWDERVEAVRKAGQGPFADFMASLAKTGRLPDRPPSSGA